MLWCKRKGSLLAPASWKHVAGCFCAVCLQQLIDCRRAGTCSNNSYGAPVCDKPMCSFRGGGSSCSGFLDCSVTYSPVIQSHTRLTLIVYVSVVVHRIWHCTCGLLLSPVTYSPVIVYVSVVVHGTWHCTCCLLVASVANQTWDPIGALAD